MRTFSTSFLTLQRYDIYIAVLEGLTFFFKLYFKRAVIFGHGHFGQIRKSTPKIRHYNINIYIYSEYRHMFSEMKMTTLTYGRACSRSGKLKRVWLFSRSIAAFNFQFSTFNFQLYSGLKAKNLHSLLFILHFFVFLQAYNEV